MLFGEHVRQDPALSRSSFTELAKETGKRWSEISHEERVNKWEAPTANKLQDYKEELERYKQTENYRSYQAYLVEYKQSRNNPELIIPQNHKVSSTYEPLSPNLLST